MCQAVNSEPGVKVGQVVRKVLGDEEDRVKNGRQSRLLAGAEDGMVAPVTPQGMDARGGKVDADDARVVRIFLDLEGRFFRLLRAGDDDAQQPLTWIAPLLDQPRVVSAGQCQRVVGILVERQLEQMVWEKNPDVDFDGAQLRPHGLWS